MTSQEFVDFVRTRAAESAATSILENAETPPGDPPFVQWCEINRWYKQLDAQSMEKLRFLINEATKGAIFGFLCILDGVRVVSSEQVPPINGEFVLEFRTKENSNRLNAGWIDGPFLHDLL